ncbi:MAG: response regulator [Acidobacteriota bacterium]
MLDPRVLVVDDNEIELDVLRVVLEAAGFEVSTLSSVFELSTTIRHQRPDVILLDVYMPALSGDRAAAILKQYGFSRDIPVIFHSSAEADELATLTAAAGAHGFVRKTGDFDGLIETLREALGQQASAR